MTSSYKGNCHCGAFIFTFTTPTPIDTGSPCNCSICSRKAYLWVVPENFQVVKGDEDTTLAKYEFGTMHLAHKFCPTCGISVLARQKDPSRLGGVSVLVNLRTVQDIDLTSITVKPPFNGAAKGDPYKTPAFVPVAGEVAEGATEYHGNCQCGAVAFTLVSPEKITEARECNCSINSRQGGLWTYPATSSITFRGVPDAVTEYTFGNHKTFHGFCKHCGVTVYERFLWEFMDGKTALNIRTIVDGEVDMDGLKIERVDGAAFPPAYVVPT
ncbi:Glutathione-dependent formaldehyde-activating [Mycena chlorophos]|uniref:Glutathione-dependent formaldehyde-activating n=1 Tax=Mycena chlorophos TaxID=658473 RepID=A0A8H6VZS0_MYCCL|nr:Glutathione-dependent formaldehyde-activating [Mycena chlorophos]